MENHDAPVVCSPFVYRRNSIRSRIFFFPRLRQYTGSRSLPSCACIYVAVSNEIRQPEWRGYKYSHAPSSHLCAAHPQSAEKPAPVRSFVVMCAKHTRTPFLPQTLLLLFCLIYIYFFFAATASRLWDIAQAVDPNSLDKLPALQTNLSTGQCGPCSLCAQTTEKDGR